jgi:hypothetical protein
MRNLDSILNRIIEQKRPCYFVSPHFDDAIFSSSEAIEIVVGKVPVTVINVFTNISYPPYSISVKRYLAQCGVSDATKLYKERQEEDSKVFKDIGVPVKNLGFVDSQWRKKQDKPSILGKFVPEIDCIYPIYKLHIISGKISKYDSALIVSLGDMLRNLISEPNAVVFCPVGVGNHVDHLIVRNVCKEMFSNTIYWCDHPYSLDNTYTTNFTEGNGLEGYSLPVNANRKKRDILKYESQVGAIFGKRGPNIVDETYYVSPKLYEY